jgi:cell fate regulator YaaT (PSP1 superfamily)
MVATALEYLVSHGKTGALGRFMSACPERFARGDHVVLQSQRGLTLGVVLCEVSPRQAGMLAEVGIGDLLRRAGPEDDEVRRQSRQREQDIFDASRALASDLALPLEILDIELSLDGNRVILQYLLGDDRDLSPLVERLAARFEMEVLLENLAAPAEVEHAGGCGEPDCGRKDGGTGCTTCATGGGCSSCGSGKTDLRPYFAHLREKLDDKRTTLL